MPTFEELVPKHRGNYADTAVYFMAEIGSDEPIIVTYNTNYEDADDIVGACGLEVKTSSKPPQSPLKPQS